MRVRSAAVLGVLLGAALGFASGLAWRARDAPAPESAPVPAPSPGPSLAPPRDDALLRAERDRLRQQVTRLEAELEQALAERGATAAEGGSAAGSGEEQARAEREAVLGSAGWPPAEIERLREAYEAYELELLYLRNQATREGWLGRPRFRREDRALLRELQEELGETRFDAALYARGRNNRVRVQSLLESSPAAAAGLQVGDEILRYAGERIYGPMPLVRETARGEAGRPVELRVLRDGEEIRLFVPRGPLGVRLEAVSRPPFERP